MPSPQADFRFPLAQADLCVKCGLCLPHCPTYVETQHESDSPRGRIALMQGLANGTLLPTSSLQAHLDGCLSCRSCERVCPAKVPYGELIDAGRTLLMQTRASPLWIRALAPWLRARKLRRLARHLLRAYRASGLQRWIRRYKLLGHGRLARFEAIVPAHAEPCDVSPSPVSTITSHDAKRPLLFFSGCVDEMLDAETQQHIRTLLSRCGFAVDVPARQTCCGALQQHAGLREDALRLQACNAAAFTGEACVTYASSGCGAMLKDYAWSGDASAAALATRVKEPHRLLLEHWPADVTLRPLRARIAVHLPCTQRNLTRGEEAMLTLLRKIPEVSLERIENAAGCCGAAGTYFAHQPAMSDRLLDTQLDALAALAPDLIVSSNIGCTLHLAAGLRRRGITAPVRHPLAVLAQQWPSDR